MCQELDSFKLDDLKIIVEKFDSTNHDNNRYNLDNQIYTVGKKMYYNYYLLDRNGIKYLMTKDSTKDWILDKLENRNPKSVSQIMMTVNYGLSPFSQFIKDYNQTVIKYDFIKNDYSLWTNEMTGLIENKKNIWIHPPRTDLFKILELNPFPYIKQPFVIGNNWEWELEFGSHWSDKRWLMWEGKRINKIKYEITRNLTIQTEVGSIDCLEIIANAKSELGSTSLTAYFNTNLGFVKFDYVSFPKVRPFKS
jgi:hypothetical protein